MKNILFNEIIEKSKNEFLNNQNPELIKKLYENYCLELDQMQMLTNENKNTILKALIRARMSIKEAEINALNNQLEDLKKEIKEQEQELYNIAKTSFKELNNMELNDVQKNFLEDLMIQEASALNILYETSQNAFINILESKTMIEERSFLFSNYMLINVLEYAKFNKDTIINSAKLILLAAIELANEWQSYANELLIGVLNGLLEGVLITLERLKKVLEASLSNKELDFMSMSLFGIESDFINMIKSSITNDFAGQITENILNNKLNNSFSKFARLVRENKQLLNIKLIKFQNSELNSKIRQELTSIEKEAKRAYDELDVKKLATKLINKLKK